MESNRRRRVIKLAMLLSAVVLIVAACKSGGGDEADGSTGEEAAGGEETAPVATGGDPFTLAEGFAAMTLEGRSGGNVDATTHGGECRGNIASTPDHAMTVTGTVTAMLAVDAGEADTTLVILGPGGPYCNDDLEDLNPGLQATFEAGSYQVYVGNYSADEGPTAYQLTVSPGQAEAPPGGGAPGSAPTAPGGQPAGGVAPPTSAPAGP